MKDLKEYLRKLNDTSIGELANLDIDLIVEIINVLRKHDLTIGQTSKLFSDVSLVLNNITKI